MAFVQLGMRHILDVRALDHVLFLLALAAVYRASDWREVVWVATSFTVGHSITLALAVTGAVSMPTPLIEFLIPVTIVATCIENIIVTDRPRTLWGGRYRPIFAGIFGLVHGAGFANYLRSLFLESIAVPLLGFNIGIEVGQLLVLAAAAVAFMAADRVIGVVRAHRTDPSPLRIRILMFSSVIAVVAGLWAVERRFW